MILQELEKKPNNNSRIRPYLKDWVNCMKTDVSGYINDAVNVTFSKLFLR